MELHQLRYLRAVVRSGSVTLAAQAELVAQPSVSKQLRQLERELGVPLFHRVGRRVVPTEAARELADCAGRIFDDLAATTAAISGPDSARGGTLRMCATETVSDNLLPPALSNVRAAYPNARIRVEMLGTDDGVARVLAGEVDLALVVLPLADGRLDIHELLTEDVLLAVPPGHGWAKRRAAPLATALADPALLLSMPGHGLRALIDESARAAGIALAAPLELRSQQALLAMVASGGGIAFTPRMSVAARTDVVALPLTPPLSRQVGWVRRRGRHLPAVATHLLELLAGPPQQHRG